MPPSDRTPPYSQDFFTTVAPVGYAGTPCLRGENFLTPSLARHSGVAYVPYLRQHPAADADGVPTVLTGLAAGLFPGTADSRSPAAPARR
jgi:hypothetical protein